MKKLTIRKLDDQERLVIPKEFRTILQLHENEPIEVAISGKQIILEKFQLLESFLQTAEQILQIYESLHLGPVIICDCKYVLTSKGVSLSQEAPITSELAEYIENHTIYLRHSSKELFLTENDNVTVGALVPIRSNGQPQGAVILPYQGKAVAPDQLSVARFMAAQITDNIENQL